MSPKVAIIVVNYNNWIDTIECLDSLKNLKYENFKVFLVDNGSDKKQPENFKIENYRGIFDLEIIFTGKNLGFAGGNNVAIKKTFASDFDYILLLNNDTLVEPDFLSRLVEIGESDKKIGIIGPLIYKYPTIINQALINDQVTKQMLKQVHYDNLQNKIWFAGGKIQFLPPKAYHLVKIPNFKFQIQNSITESDYITGCCLLIKREVIDKIGLLPEVYFLYYEDVEWCLKARKIGYKCILNLSSIIYHKQSKSALEGSFLYIYYHIRNGFLFAKRNAPAIIKLFLAFYSIWLFNKQIIKWIIMPSKRFWANAIIKGILDYWHNKTGKY